MNKEQKYQVIEKVAGCKTLEMFESVCEELSEEEILYAKCVWVCKKYQSNRSKDKENKLKRVCEENNIDLEEMIAFSKTNLKHNETDRHFANIIKLDKKLNDEKILQDKLDFIGEEAIEIAPIDHPTKYDEENQQLRFSLAYAHNYGKFHLDNEPLEKNAFGHKLKVKTINNNEYKFNAIILSQRVIDKKLFTVTNQTQIHKEFGKGYSITKELNKKYRQDIMDKLDDEGLAKVGSIVREGDILIGCVTAETDKSLMDAQTQLLYAIFGANAMTKDVPIYSTINYGIVSDVSKYKEKSNTIVELILDTPFALEVGDYLGDVSFRKGQVVEIISEEEMINRFGANYDLVANFDLDSYILRYNPIVKKELLYSIGENYSIGNQQPLAFNDVKKPLTIEKKVLDKFIKYDMQEALAEVVKYSRKASDENWVSMQIIENGEVSINKDDIVRINYIKNFLRAIGFELVVCPNDNGYDIEFKKISDEEKLSISCGEVTSSWTYNPRTMQPESRGLFAEEIFGPEKDFRCRCGRYVGKEHAGVICEKCGVEVSSKFARNIKFGHIVLDMAAQSIFGGITNTILVLPPNIRPVIAMDGRMYSSDINEFYRHIINVNDRLKKLKELGSYGVLIENEKRRLQEAVVDYEKKILGLISRHTKLFTQRGNIIHSVSGICCVKKGLDNNKCLMPIDAVIKLLEPYIIRELSTRYQDRKEVFKKLRTFDSEIMDILPEVVKNKKIVLFSNINKGEIICLDIGLTKGSAILLSEENSSKIALKNNIINGFVPMTANVQEIIENKINEKSEFCEFETDFLKELDLAEGEDCIHCLKKAILSRKVEIKTRIGKFAVKAIL